MIALPLCLQHYLIYIYFENVEIIVKYTCAKLILMLEAHLYMFTDILARQ